ncbi:hypothetical protein BGW39_008889 [Mortierella sp. 14UC]|nr:hypothetical protein BGW39_008889 [Mortierella sp. 14UC]
MTATLDVIIANNDVKIVDVPYKLHEPILFLVGRIRAALGADEGSIIWRASNQRNSALSLPGKLPEDSRTLADYHIKKDSNLHFVMLLRGGGTLRGMVFSDVSDISNVRKIQFSKDAPPGRVATSGTNIECECECTPTHRVICRKPFGTLELSGESSTCPNCLQSENIVPATVGFLTCQCRFHGLKSSGKQYTSNWRRVEAVDCYQQFITDKKIAWRRLVIQSAPLDAYDECTICLEALRVFKTLACGHRFHAACIKNWRGSCPNCRCSKNLTIGGVAYSDDTGTLCGVR